MSKSRKSKKGVAEVAVVTAVVPVASVAAVTPKAVILQPWQKVPVVKTAEVAVVQHFNRTGMDALLEASIGKGPSVVKEKVASKIFTKGTFLKMAEEMLRNGSTGQDVIEAIADEYERRGNDRGREYGVSRGKTILQHARREIGRQALREATHQAA